MSDYFQRRWLPLLPNLALLVLMVGCGGNSSSPTASSHFTRTNLVGNKNTIADSAGTVARTDANLVNPWGMAYSPNGAFWIANNGTGTSTLYDGAGTAQPLIVTIPGAAAANGGAVTGTVYNGTASFTVAGAPASFLFASEDGTITAWTGGANATLVANQSGAGAGAVYKGLAIGSVNGSNFLFAANFRAGRVDVFDTNFGLVRSFTDATVDAGFAPFGIQNIGGNLIVTFARQDAAKHDDVAGAGNGFVDVFDTNGNLIRRLVSHGALNSPWGIVQAPASFGAFANALLVGNFGDGHINAFNPNTGAFLGTLTDSQNNPIAISGLWGLLFGNGGSAGATGTLYFTAGFNDEQDGLFGKIVPGP